jgi:Uma2 family endonuclease
MAQLTEILASDWTAADLVERFGAIPLWRVRRDPAPGTATEDDVVAINDHEDRLCELVEGILVEKAMSAYESYLAMFLGRLLGNYVAENDLGIVLGEAGMLRLAPGLVRIPDVSFISWDHLPGRRIPREAIWDLAPDLAIEIISKGNTPEEMARKLADYFAAGVRAVWYVYPASQEVRVYAAAEQCATLTQEQTLDGGEVLPGFSLDLQAFFAEPTSA